jgi:hypothetical protein
VNRHELIDIATVRLNALFLSETTFFVRSVDAPALVDATIETTPPVNNIDDPSTAGRCDVAADTPPGEFETAFLSWQWLGPESPTLVYHYGSGERPFDVGRFSTNSFRRLFLTLKEDLLLNLIAPADFLASDARDQHVDKPDNQDRWVGDRQREAPTG